MHSGMKALQDNVSQVSGYMEPLRNFTNGNPNCANDGICSLVLKAVEPMDSVVAATASLTASTTKFGAGAQGMQKSFSGAVDSVKNMRATVAQLGAITDQLTHAVGETRTMFSGLTEYLRAMREDFRSSGEGGYYLPQRAWQDPRFQRAAGLYFGPDGHSTRMLVFGDGKVFGADGAHRSPQIMLAVSEATKEGHWRAVRSISPGSERVQPNCVDTSARTSCCWPPWRWRWSSSSCWSCCAARSPPRW